MNFKKGALWMGIFLVLSLFAVEAFQFSVTTQSDFNQGAYTNTTYNITAQAMQLTPLSVSGLYLSQIYDGLDTSQWTTLTSNESGSTLPFLVVVDNKDDVWSSYDGVSWKLAADDYNSGDGGGDDAQFVFADYRNYFYSIEDDDDVWRSLDRGAAWTKVNDDYNGESQHVVTATADYNGNLYLIESDEDVWKSTDQGTTWAKINGTDFNGGNGNVVSLVVNSSNNLLVVDNDADVWTSTDGVAWALAADNYNGGESNNPSYLLIDSQNRLYSIEADDDVWKSTDSGTTWTKVNDDYNGESQHVVTATADYNGNLYLIESDEDVWKSTDQGTTWAKINGTDFNGGNGNVVSVFALNASAMTTIQARSCAALDCSDGTFATTGTSLSVANNRYFQFRLNLTSDENDLTPSVFSLLLDYLDVGIPSITAVTTLQPNVTVSEVITLNATVIDGLQLDTVLANLTLPDSSQQILNMANSSATAYFLSYNASQLGSYSFTIIGNDTSNNLNDSEGGSFFTSSSSDTQTPVITPGSCTPDPATLGEEVTCNATITDNIQIATVLVNVTFADATFVFPSATNISDVYSFTVNASVEGTAIVGWFVNDSSNNQDANTNQAFTVSDSNQGSGGEGNGGSGNSQSQNNGGDSGFGSLRNAPPGTPVIGRAPVTNTPSSPPATTSSEGANIVQQPRASQSPNSLTGAAVGEQTTVFTFKNITLSFFILALLSFIVSYFLRERRVRSKHLYRTRPLKKIMVKDPQLLDKLQGYVSAEVLDKLKKGDHLRQKRVDPKDKEFAHQFPETAKEIHTSNYQTHPKKLDYGRLEQAKKDIHKANSVVSAIDLQKIFPETLGKGQKLDQTRFVLTSKTQQTKTHDEGDQFSDYYSVKQPEKTPSRETKQAPQSSRKVNKVSKQDLLKGLQEVYDLEQGK